MLANRSGGERGLEENPFGLLIDFRTERIKKGLGFFLNNFNAKMLINIILNYINGSGFQHVQQLERGAEETNVRDRLVEPGDNEESLRTDEWNDG